jgi:hypothetical protein
MDAKKIFTVAVIAALCAACCKNDNGGDSPDEPPVTIDDSGYWQDWYRQKELHGKVKTVTGDRYGYNLEFDSQGNLVKEGSYLAYQYDDKHRIVKIFYDGEETTQIAYDGRHSVYMPSDMVLNHELRLQQGITSLNYAYEDDDVAGKLELKSIEGNKLNFTIQYDETTCSFVVEKSGNFIKQFVINPELVNAPYLGARSLIYSFEYDAGGMFKRITVSSPQVAGVTDNYELTGVTGFMNLVTRYTLENGAKKSEYNYFYNENGHIATEYERYSSGRIYEYRYAYEYDSRKNWTKRTEEEKRPDGSWLESETVNRTITYW